MKTTIASEKEKTIQSIYELRIEYPKKLHSWGRHDSEVWFSTQVLAIFDHIVSVAKQEGREEAIEEVKGEIKRLGEYQAFHGKPKSQPEVYNRSHAYGYDICLDEVSSYLDKITGQEDES